jgi:membrane protein required for colicin V production
MVPAVNWVDWALLAVFSLFGLRGYFKGLFREVLSLCGLVVGFMVAVRYDERVAALAVPYWNLSPFILKGGAFVVVFFVVYFLFNVAGWLLHHSEKALFLQTVNRVGGIAVGIGKGAALMALIVFILHSASWVPYSTKESLENSYLVSPLSRLGEGLIRIGKEKLFSAEGGAAQKRPKALLVSYKG